MAAVVQYARVHGRHISIFAARHHAEAGRQLGAAELRNALRYGDDSQLPTPGLFFYAQGMPVVVTRNLHVGLKVVNGAPFTAVDIVPDPAYATFAVADDATFDLGPPLAVLLQSDAIGDVAIPGLPPGTILLGSKTVAVPDAVRGKGARIPKSQGKQFGDVLLNLKGAYGGTGGATRPSFMSLHVQLSRATRWDGLYLFQEPARSDFIEPRNVLDDEMRAVAARLERRGDETRKRFRREHGQTAWFAAWDAIEEAPATAAACRGGTTEEDTAV